MGWGGDFELQFHQWTQKSILEEVNWNADINHVIILKFATVFSLSGPFSMPSMYLKINIPIIQKINFQFIIFFSRAEYFVYLFILLFFLSGIQFQFYFCERFCFSMSRLRIESEFTQYDVRKIYISNKGKQM